MLIVLILLVALIVFILVRRHQKKKDPERFATKSEERRANLAVQRNKLNRKMLLYYIGGHPKLARSGPCWVTRSDDDTSVEIRIGKESVTIPTQAIKGIQLIEQSDVVTKQKSGVGGAIVGDLLAGPAGAIVGGMATRRKKSKVVHRDRAVMTFKNGDSEYQIVFSDASRKASSRWYPKAVSVLSPHFQTTN